MKTSKQTVRFLVVAEHSLVQPPVFIHISMWLNSVWKVQQGSKDAYFPPVGQQLWIDSDAGTGYKISSITADIFSGYSPNEGKQ